MTAFWLKTLGASIIMFLFLNVSYAQQKLTCNDIHEGVFYNYPKNSTDRYIDIREGELVHENNLVTGDTSLWKIKWNNDCTYTLSLIDMNGKLEQQTRELMKKHKLLFSINDLTNDYYVFTGYFDKASTLPIIHDTMWMHEKVNIYSNELFKQVSDSVLLKKPIITDTSKYALLFVYRPGKTALAMANYLIYFDDNVMCVAQNNSGYIFKILREGKFELKSRLNKDESSLPLNIHFGKRYFVETEILWGIYKHLSNYKLQNTEVSQEQVEAEFKNSKHF